MRRWVYLILFLFTVVSRPAPAFPREVVAMIKQTKSVCRFVSSAASYLNPIPFLQRKFGRDPLYLDTDEFREVSQTTIADYFPSGEVTPEGMAKLADAFRKVAFNFERVHLGKGKLRHKDEVLNDILAAFGVMERQNADLTAMQNRPLVSFFLDEHAAQSKREADLPRGLRTLPGKSGRALIAGGVFIAGLVGHQLVWNLRMIGYETTDFVNTPVRNNISKVTNERAGWIGVWMQMSITQMEQAMDVHSKMLQEVDKMDDAAAKMAAAKKFQVEGMSLDDIRKVWLQGEEAFLEYRKELNSVLPDLVGVGRSYYRDAIITNPLTFSNAVATVKTLVNQTEDRISNLTYRRKKEGELSEMDEKLLAQAYVDLESAKRQMGTTLALIRVYQVFYPEHARPSWDGKSDNPFMNQYGIVIDGLGMEYYAQQYSAELKLQMAAMSLTLSGADINAVGKRQNEIAIRLKQLAESAPGVVKP